MEKKTAVKTAKKVVSIIINIILGLFIALCVVLIAFSLFGKKDKDGTVIIFGMQMRVVISPSMEKCDATDVSGYKIKDIPFSSMVFIQTVPDDEEEKKEWYSKLEVGDVLTFRYDELVGLQDTITHRIIAIEEAYGGYKITLEGDNKNSNKNPGKQYIYTSRSAPEYSEFKYVVGKVTGQSRVLGWLVYGINFSDYRTVVLVLIIIVPCSIIIILQVIRIVGAVNEEKRKKQAEEQTRQSEEIEELKRKLAAMEAKQSPEEQEENKVQE